MNDAAISQLLETAVGEGAVPGLAAVLGNAAGTIYEQHCGLRDTEFGFPVESDTVFWIASLTKAVTTTAAMQLVERGLVALDAPAGDILPELGALQVLRGYKRDGTPILEPARSPVTLRQLLNHTSGFTYFSWHAPTLQYEKWAGLPPLFSCEDAALSFPLGAHPGMEWNYGIGVDWAGKLVEKISGQRLEAFFRENIFGPLEMNDTGFLLSSERRRRLARVHERGAEGRFQPIDMELPQSPQFFMGGGGLYSTAKDYMRFMRAFLGGGSVDGRRILEAETVGQMSRNQIGELRVRPLVSTANDPSAEFFPGLPKAWGLGFMINLERAPTGRSPGSLAWAGSANCYFWIDPASDLAGLIMMQYLPFADPAAMDLFARFETASYGALPSAL